MKRAVTIAALFLLLAPSAQAQTAADPVADLAAMTAKAQGNPYLEDYMRRFSVSLPIDQRRMMALQIFEQFPEARDGVITRPIHYVNYQTVAQARNRAQMISQILVADLDNDGQITKAEVRQTLEFIPESGAASAFFTSDTNDDSILQPEEIRAAVDLQMQTRNGRAYLERTTGLMLFDFDADGYLTPEEMARGMAALGLQGN